MTDVLKGTLAQIAAQVEDLNIKLSVLVAYDYANQTWFVVGGDSISGKVDVDTT